MNLTIATVGFGDVVPKTAAGKALITLLVISTGFLIPYHLTQLLHIYRIYGRKQKEYKSSEKFKHIILTGSLKTSSIMDFLREFISRINRPNENKKNIKIVALTNNTITDEIMTILSDPFFDDTFKIIQGTSTLKSDLARVNLDSAKACIILADKNSPNELLEDASNTMSTLAVKDFCPKMKTYVQFIFNDRKQNLEQFGIDGSISTKVMKMDLLSLNCMYPGTFTFMNNLIQTHHPISSKKKNFLEWEKEYRNGLSMEIYTVVLPKAFKHKTFGEASRIIFQKISIILFAIVVDDLNDNPVCLFNPGDTYFINTGDIGYVIADSPETARRVSMFKIYKKRNSIFHVETEIGLSNEFNFKEIEQNYIDEDTESDDDFGDDNNSNGDDKFNDEERENKDSYESNNSSGLSGNDYYYSNRMKETYLKKIQIQEKNFDDESKYPLLDNAQKINSKPKINNNAINYNTSSIKDKGESFISDPIRIEKMKAIKNSKSHQKKKNKKKKNMKRYKKTKNKKQFQSKKNLDKLQNPKSKQNSFIIKDNKDNNQNETKKNLPFEKFFDNNFTRYESSIEHLSKTPQTNSFLDFHSFYRRNTLQSEGSKDSKNENDQLNVIKNKIKNTKAKRKRRNTISKRLQMKMSMHKKPQEAISVLSNVPISTRQLYESSTSLSNIVSETQREMILSSNNNIQPKPLRNLQKKKNMNKGSANKQKQKLIQQHSRSLHPGISIRKSNENSAIFHTLSNNNQKKKKIDGEGYKSIDSSAIIFRGESSDTSEGEKKSNNNKSKNQSLSRSWKKNTEIEVKELFLTNNVKKHDGDGRGDDKGDGGENKDTEEGSGKGGEYNKTQDITIENSIIEKTYGTRNIQKFDEKKQLFDFELFEPSPIVYFTEKLPDEKQFEQLQKCDLGLTNIYFFVHKTFDPAIWFKINLAYAKGVVILPDIKKFDQLNQEDKHEYIIDSDTICLARMLFSIQSNPNLTIELCHPSNISYFKTQSKNNYKYTNGGKDGKNGNGNGDNYDGNIDQNRGVKKNVQKANSILLKIQNLFPSYSQNNVFASGKIFMEVFFDSLFANAFFTPDILQIMKKFTKFNRLDLSENIQQSRFFSIPLPKIMIGKKFINLFNHLSEEKNVIALGLLRAQNNNRLKNNLPYVVVNPKPQTTLFEEKKMSFFNFSLTTFSPNGKLLQIEHALKAVESGATSLGIKASNGVVIVTEKKLPTTLIDENSVKKIQNLNDGIGVIYSGLGPDYRVLLSKARKKSQQYFKQYNEIIPVNIISRKVAGIMQEFTQSGGVRPFGVSLLVAGYDHNGPQLFQVDPSGSFWAWKATAIGKNSSNSKKFLEKRYKPDMEIEDAINTAILTLKEGFEGEMDEFNIEVGVIKNDKKFRILEPEEVKDYISELNL
ncbi:proteasome subunit alpha type-2 [Anaeramoeba flamelloides]|uniref:Proteasome subunit alpha type-2 n=1 Tax=Anaeramoeba flamelloides TaxID=1746091 RepID=A0ABQ8YVD2_9EUKA|nr:proteasome subunit alpha type-2 [Anaeramoeba flamelloides]